QAKVPLVIHSAHNWACHELLPVWKKNFYLMLERKAAQWCDAIIVDSKAVKEYGLQLRIAPEDKIHQIYMGIDLEQFYEYSPEEKTAW
ncbi:MAG: glycosyltransferase, partial [Candidatus Omnitrophota bacterium]